MGELEGVKGAWGYVEGGMGAVSQAISNCATDHGAHVFTDKVKQGKVARGPYHKPFVTVRRIMVPMSLLIK